jgi:D-threo-aldose 1-dehydrogenase
VTELARRLVAGAGVQLTTFSFGAAQIGNLDRAMSDAAAREAVDAAWEGGVRYFDTAPHYGLGLSERRLGAALRDRPRDEFVVSTKVGRILVPSEGGAHERDGQGFDVPATYRREWDFSRDGILRSVEASLARLGLDHVDVLYLHDPDHHWQQALDEGFPALAELRDQGIVKAVGAGMNQAEMLAAFVRHTEMDLIMLAGRYTLLEQGALDEFLPMCAERGVNVVAAGVFNSGLLSLPRPSAGATYNYTQAPRELIERAHRIADICERHGTSLPAAALQFPLAHPVVASVAVGCRTAEHVERNLQLFQALPPAELWTELRDDGLLRADAPIGVVV